MTNAAIEALRLKRRDLQDKKACAMEYRKEVLQTLSETEQKMAGFNRSIEEIDDALKALGGTVAEDAIDESS